MLQNRIPILAGLAAVLTLLLVGSLVSANVSYASRHPGGERFLLNWMGGRAFLLSEEDPYSRAVAQNAQRLLGRPDASTNPRLDLPFYLLLFSLPFAALQDYTLARGLWMSLLQAALVATTLSSLGWTGWRPPKFLLAFFLFFGLFWFHGLLPVVAGDAVIWLGLLFSAALLQLRRGADEQAGLLLALATFQWETGGLFLLFVLVWVVSHRRLRVLAGFAMALVLLLVVATMVWPGWYLPYLRAVYTNLTGGDFINPLAVFDMWWPGVSHVLGWGLAIFLGLVLLAEWVGARRKSFRHFVWVACLTLAVTPLLGLPVRISGYTVFILPLALILALVAERWEKYGAWIAAALMAALLAGSWWLPMQSLAAGQSLAATLLIPVPAFLFFGLYWLRWWALRQPVSWLVDTDLEDL
jgi:hypothetical protein